MKPLLAIVHGPARQSPDDLSAVPCGAFTAFFDTTKRVRKIGRKAVLRYAVRRQAQLEQLLPVGTVLPALQGVMLPQGDVAQAIGANIEELTGLSDRLVGRVQYQISVSGDPQAALVRLAAPGTAFSGCKNPDELAQRFGAYSRELLDPIAAELSALPLTEGTFANMAVLVDVARVAELDRALERIDALWSDGLRIRQIGPSPAVSFASIGFKRVGAGQLRAARKRLGLLAPETRRDDILRAKRAALRSNPGDAEDIRCSARWLDQAAASGQPKGPVYDLFTWSEGRATGAAAHALRGAA